MEQGWDPEIKKYFLRIIKSVSVGLMWLMACIAGLYYELAYTGSGTPLVFVIIYYVCAAASFLWLLVYLRKLWKISPILLFRYHLPTIK
jgi:hypothetical protein